MNLQQEFCIQTYVATGLPMISTNMNKFHIFFFRKVRDETVVHKMYPYCELEFFLNMGKFHVWENEI